MSAASFVGLLVTCALKDQTTVVQGTVSSIDGIQGSITLENAEVQRGGQEVHHLPYMVLSRNDVLTLRVLDVRPSSGTSLRSTPKSSTGNTKETYPDHPGSNGSPSVSSGLARSFDQHAAPLAEGGAGGGGGGQTTEYPPTSRTSSNRSEVEELHTKPARVKGKGGVRRKKLQRERSDGGAGNEADESAAPFDDEEPERRVSDALAGGSAGVIQNPLRPTPFDEDFDFASGLRFFDKDKVFDQIRSQDDTDPALRLHAHNRNRGLAKLAPNESVLSLDELHEQERQAAARAPLPSHHRRVAESPEEETSDFDAAEETQNVSAPAPALTRKVPERRGSNRAGGAPPRFEGSAKSHESASRKGFFTAQNGIKAVEVRLKQYKEALSIADIETGPTLLQRTENASRGIASFIFTHLARDRQLFPSQNRKRPTVCIVCDDCEKGAVALRAGVHLSNHGARVFAFILARDDHSELFRNNLRVLSSAGGRIIRESEDLESQYDLIIDAIADNETQGTLEFKSPEALAAASWAGDSGIPILSIDSPFGVDHDTGLSISTCFIRPEYIVCRGAVRTGCGAPATQAEIVLVDVGLFPSVWGRVGAEEWTEYGTFEGEFVVPLRRGD